MESIKSINSRYEHGECTIQSHHETIRNNFKLFDSEYNQTEFIVDAYEELTEDLHRISKSLKIGPESLGTTDPPDPTNMFNYAREIEKRVDSILYKLACAQNSCLVPWTEDQLTSDAESTENPFGDEYYRIDIKRHQLNTEHPSSLPISNEKLEVKYLPPPCPQ